MERVASNDGAGRSIHPSLQTARLIIYQSERAAISPTTDSALQNPSMETKTRFAGDTSATGHTFEDVVSSRADSRVKKKWKVLRLYLAKAKLPIMGHVPFDQRWTRKVSTFLSHGQCDRLKSHVALKKASALTVGHANRLGKISPTRPEIRVLAE
jgi:hypothetical protein